MAKWIGCSLAAVNGMPTEYYDTAIEMIREEQKAIQQGQEESDE